MPPRHTHLLVDVLLQLAQLLLFLQQQQGLEQPLLQGLALKHLLQILPTTGRDGRSEVRLVEPQ
jgi:hypothetical protein